MGHRPNSQNQRPSTTLDRVEATLLSITAPGDHRIEIALWSGLWIGESNA